MLVPYSSASVFNHVPSYWSVDFGKGAAWDDLSADGSRGLSFAGDQQMSGSLGQWISWPSAPNGNVTYSPTSALPGVLFNVSTQTAGLLQSPDNPLDLLILCG